MAMTKAESQGSALVIAKLPPPESSTTNVHDGFYRAADGRAAHSLPNLILLELCSPFRGHQVAAGHDPTRSRSKLRLKAPSEFQDSRVRFLFESSSVGGTSRLRGEQPQGDTATGHRAADQALASDARSQTCDS
jgi:hypothetical protein